MRYSWRCTVNGKTMKPDNALEFVCPPGLSELAIQDAMNMMELNLTAKACNLVIAVSKWYLFHAAEIANRMSGTVANLNVIVILDHSYDQCEWSVRDLETNSIAWSPGA